MGNLSFWIDDNVIYAILATLVICFTVRTICRSRVDHAWAKRTTAPAELYAPSVSRYHDDVPF